jgi:hypothetical protein
MSLLSNINRWLENAQIPLKMIKLIYQGLNNGGLKTLGIAVMNNIYHPTRGKPLAPYIMFQRRECDPIPLRAMSSTPFLT